MAEPIPPVLHNAQPPSLVAPSPGGGGDVIARLLVEQGLVTETQLS